MHELPEKYTNAERWAKEFLERLEELLIAYQDPDYRKYFRVMASKERAAVRRASLDLSRALSTMRKSGE